MLKQLVDGFVDLVYPPHCIICKTHNPARFPTENLCARCDNLIQKNVPPFCLKCSRHLSARHESSLCPYCMKFRYAFDFCWSACLYTKNLRTLLLAFKYSQKTMLRHIFLQLMVAHIDHYYLDIHQFDYLLPVPLHPARQRERGFNQAGYLAQGLAGHFDIPISPPAVTKARHHKSQSLIHEKERFTNVHNAFKIKDFSTYKDKNILIIDDLLTTGATASELASQLKLAQANIVGVFTLAITP